MTNPSSQPGTNRKNILVVGDWTVDENWVASIHRSSTSSRTGNKHLLGLNTLKGATESLCGAGVTAATIRGAVLKKDEQDELEPLKKVGFGPSSRQDFCRDLELYNVIGIGMWHPNDTRILENMLVPDNNATSLAKHYGHPLNLIRENLDPNGSRGNDIKLINLANWKALHDEIESRYKKANPDQGQASPGKNINGSKEYFGTTKIVRIFEHNLKSVQINCRFDWEVTPPPGMKHWLDFDLNKEVPEKRDTPNKTIPAYQSLSNYLSEKVHEAIVEFGGSQLDAIVIKDLGKGVTSKELIRCLRKLPKKEFGDPPWYISTKSWKPDWLVKECFKQANVRLYMIPTVAATKAMEQKAITRWINPRGYATGRALRTMDDIRNDFEKPMVLVLPSGHRVIAIKDNSDPQNDPVILQLERDILANKGNVETQFASVLLGALVACDLHPEHEDSRLTFQDLKQTLAFSHHWMTTYIERLMKPEQFDPNKNGTFYQFKDKDYSEGKVNWEKGVDVKTAIELWNQSRCPEPGQPPVTERLTDNNALLHDHELNRREHNASRRSFLRRMGNYFLNAKRIGNDSDHQNYIGYGVLGQTNEMRFDIWRSMNEIDGYSCIVPSKRQKLQKIVTEMKRFKKGPRKESKSCLLIAPPGSGKTHLVKCLAASLDYHYHYFNIAQMNDKTALQSALEKLSTDMAHRADKPWLVCFDEINKPVSLEYTYGSFLAPLEEGVFMRGDNLYKLDPCFWIFIGTKLPDEEKDKIPNWSDLRSRLTMPHLNLLPEPSENKAHQLEMVYTAMSMLVNRFPDVKWVSIDVLKVFYELGGYLTHREMNQFVRSFNNIQQGKVFLKNVSIGWIVEKISEPTKRDDLELYANRKQTLEDVKNACKRGSFIKESNTDQGKKHKSQTEHDREVWIYAQRQGKPCTVIFELTHSYWSVLS